MVVVAATCRYLLPFFTFKMIFFLLFFVFLFTFWTENMHPWIFNAFKDYTYHVQNVIYILFYRECEPKNEFVCICMLAFMWPYAMHAMPCHATLCPACVGVHIFVRYKLEHKYRMQNVSLLVNLYIFVCRKSQLIHKCKHKHKHKCTYHTWFVVQCVNTQTLHSMRMQMQMLNAQIGLDGFEKVRRKFSQRFIICIQFKIAANRISNFAFKFDKNCSQQNENKWIWNKNVEKFSSNNSSSFNCVKLQHSMDFQRKRFRKFPLWNRFLIIKHEFPIPKLNQNSFEDIKATIPNFGPPTLY